MWLHCEAVNEKEEALEWERDDVEAEHDRKKKQRLKENHSTECV